MQSASRHEIRLGPLTDAETRELASLLCDRPTAREQCIATVAQESQGSPFFLGQLIQHLTATGPVDTNQMPPSLSLGSVLTDRVQALPVSARHLLELVCIAARPLERRFALNAADITERGLPIIINLEQARLLRSTTLGGLSAVEVYHDRIREVIVGGLEAEDARARHRQIADAFARLSEPDPQELFTHYLGAGLDEIAGQYAEQAGDLAARALAFERAAELYRQAFQLQRGDRAHWSLSLRRAEALANAGRGREAGECFETAAAALAQQSPRHDDVVSLRRRAAEQYLRSGHIDRGTALMGAVLSGLGVRLPATSGRAMLSSIFHRGRFLLRGTRFEPVSTASVAPRARLRLEALWAGSTGLLVSNPILSDGLGVRCLVEALKTGERAHTIRTLGLEAVREACLGGKFFQQRSARLLQMAEDMARGNDDPYGSAWVRHCRGTSAYFCGHWQTARAECDASLAMLREQCRGVAWEVVTAESFAITTLAHMGAIRALSWRLPAALRDGDQRGDVYAATSLRMGMPSILWLAQDHADDSRRMAAEAISRWPSTTFLVQHYLHLITTVQAELYLGDAWAAWQHVQEAWPKLRSARILATVAVARVELRYLRARAALATAACHLRAPASHPDWSPDSRSTMRGACVRRSRFAMSASSLHSGCALLRYRSPLRCSCR